MDQPLVPLCRQHDDGRFPRLGDDDWPTGRASLLQERTRVRLQVFHRLDIFRQAD